MSDARKMTDAECAAMEKATRELDADLDAALAKRPAPARSPEGWPSEPTEEMVEAGILAIDEYYNGTKDASFDGSVVACYKAMLSAAPASGAQIDRLETAVLEHQRGRAEALEEAAQIADHWQPAREWREGDVPWREQRKQTAANIRSHARAPEQERFRDVEHMVDAREALEESVKLQSHYATLLNMHDGGQRMTFANADEWMDRLAALRSLPAPSPSSATDAPRWVRVLIGKARSCLIKPGEPVRWLFTDEELLATAATALSSTPAPAPSPSGKE